MIRAVTETARHVVRDRGMILRFGTVGLITTALDIVLFTALTAAGALPALANLFSYSCGIAVSYMLNRSWTFRAEGGTERAVKFVALMLAGLALSTLLVSLLATVLPAPVAKVLSVPVIFVYNYLAARLLVFRA
jgi:putative flippase GtrA